MKSFGRCAAFLQQKSSNSHDSIFLPDSRKSAFKHKTVAMHTLRRFGECVASATCFGIYGGKAVRFGAVRSRANLRSSEGARLKAAKRFARKP